MPDVNGLVDTGPAARVQHALPAGLLKPRQILEVVSMQIQQHKGNTPFQLTR